jgi:ligand-binding sensor domain-containing protein/signal transduction histidine kinase
MLLAGLALLPAYGGAVLQPVQEGSPDYVTKQFRIPDGLPSSQVHGILQSRNGYLWIATFNGLARFDGVSFKVFNSANTPQLRNSLINCLFQDKEGRLWIGSATGEITWLDDTGFHALKAGDDWPHWPVISLTQSGDGEVWALNSNGYLLRILGASTTTFLKETTVPFSAMASDTNGEIWLVGSTGGMARIEKGGVLESAEPEAVPGVPRSIAGSRAGGLWLCDGNRLRRWHAGQWAEDRGEHSWGKNDLVRLFEDSDGSVWVGTPNRGVFRVGRDGTERALGRLYELGYDEAEYFCEDREGNIWVGSVGGGLILLRHRVLSMVAPTDRWQLRSVKSVAPSKQNGIWVGTDGAGVYHFDGKGFVRLAEGDSAEAKFRVRSVLEARDGTLWIGTVGASVQNWKDGRFSRQNASPKLPNLIYATYEDSSGAVWFGTQNGVRRFSDGVWTRLAMNLSRRDVRCVAETPDGTIWIGMHGGGLAMYQSGNFTRYTETAGPPNGFISTLRATSGGDVWMGVEGVGLVRWRKGTFFAFKTQDGLPSDFISHIEIVSSGDLWAASYGGIFRVRLEDLERRARGEIDTVNCLVLDESDGLRSLDMSGAAQPTGCQSADGRLWFATSGGLAVVEPSRIRVRRIVPPVIIESVSVEGHDLYSNYRNGASGTNASSPLIEIPPGSAQVEFRYTALSLEAPQRVRFKYRMEEQDGKWQDLGNRRSVLFSRLTSGDYTFQVIACNNYGYWNTEGASVRFRVLPHYWQAWWFAPLCWFSGAGIMAGAAIGMVRHRAHERLERLQRARLVERERTRIAQDLHDDLGTGLSEISTTCALAQGTPLSSQEGQSYLREISERSIEMITALDEIVWAVNPKNDSLPSIASYFCHFAGQFLKPTSLRPRFDVEQGLPQLFLDTQQRYSLFLAFKEGLHNAVKHSGGTSLRISIFLRDEQLCIDIEDNGSGLALEEPKPGMDGLMNMRNRLENLGGTARIMGMAQGGTRVEFRLPITEQKTNA